MADRPKGQKILIVLEAGNAYPSGFLRGLIYKDYFDKAGIDAEYVNRLNPRLIRLAQSPWMPLGLRSVIKKIIFGLGRLSEKVILQKARTCEVVYMSKVTSLRLIRQLRQTNAKLVLDFGDAVWLPGRAGEKFDEVLRNVHVVTTDNELTAEYVRRINPNCTVIPDSPQVEQFDQSRSEPIKKDPTITLGWVGSPLTAYNLFVIWEALEKLFAKYSNLHLRLVGIGKADSLLPPFERISYSARPTYSQAEMIDEVLQMDIGLFPLQDVESSRVRGVLKATVYMAGQAVAVCSPVGQCVDVIKDGVNGMLAATPEEWEQKLERLILDPALREKIAEEGLATVRKQFTVAAAFAKLRIILNSTNGDLR